MAKVNWERRILGRTGFEVTVLGIGGAWLGNMRDRTDEEVAVQTVLAGLASGINLVDSSDNYIDGRSEGFVGRALAHWFAQGNRREDLVLSTKLTVNPNNPDAFSYDGTLWGLEHSLRELGVDTLDMFLVHDPETLEPVLSEDGCIAALRRAKEEGTIRAIGLGCRPHEFHRRCIETGEFDVCLTFHDYSVMERSAEAGVLEHAVQRDVGVFNASINAALARPEHAETAAELEAWCGHRGLDLATLNLQFCLRERRFASTLIGFSRPERVAQNVASYQTPVDDAIWAELRRDFGIG
jgi:D-threo-aldose 1-dehydrogenase